MPTLPANALDALLADSPGVIGAILATQAGELRCAVGRVVDREAGAAIAAVISRELTAIGALLGLGELGLASVKAPRAGRLFARQGGAVLAIEVESRQPLGGLEARLRTTPWSQVADAPATGPPTRRTSATRTTRPAPSTTSALIRAVAASAAAGTAQPPPVPAASASQPQPGTGQVFAGDLQELSLPDLLQFLRNSQRTGTLLCTSPAGTGTIQLSRGMIVSAESPGALDQLAGRADATPDEVERARVARIYSVFREMVGWTSGRFAFDPAVPVAGDAPIALSAQSILMQIYQEQDAHGR